MKPKWVKIAGLAIAVALAVAAPVIVAPVARTKEAPLLVLAYSIASSSLLFLQFYQKEHLNRVERAHGRKRRGAFDISRIVDVILIIVLMPTLVNLLGAMVGASFGQLQPLFSAFMQILPLVVVLDLFTDIVGGTGGSTFKKMFEIIKIIIVLPILLNMLSSFLGGSAGALAPLINVFMQLLPLVLVIELFTDVLK
jgi:hypothetical protein